MDFIFLKTWQRAIRLRYRYRAFGTINIEVTTKTINIGATTKTINIGAIVG
jgi:hypothetical protein